MNSPHPPTPAPDHRADTHNRRDNPVRVLIVDDDPLVLVALDTMLGGAPDITTVGQATDGAEAIAAVSNHTPDVVLMDIRMPRVDGLAATEQLRSRPNAPEIIVLTTFDTDEHVLRALRAGAAGFLLKQTPPERIVEAVRRVADGEPMLSPTVTRQLIDRLTPHTADTARDHARNTARAQLAKLSERERQVALAVARGKTNAEIGTELYVSVATVKAHITRLLNHLELNNRVQLALLTHDAELD
ncbi:response regulator transcription factor [Streptomyces catenulae]|uniref:Response regulator transcription factor n=1 Tax=Streptomyces catenulae TaxID=66875 RepID=A0ABV2YZ74_9ACTN|nr:response regulator transcription factor [Streptomyces catenulae]